MQWFWKILGFTGAPQHYDILYYVLERSSYSEKSSILNWLEQLQEKIQEQITESENFQKAPSEFTPFDEE